MADLFRGCTADEADEAARSWAENTAAATPGADISARNAWQRMLESAKRFDEPGEFGPYWLGMELGTGGAICRVVITDASLEVAGTFSPFSLPTAHFLRTCGNGWTILLLG